MRGFGTRFVAMGIAGLFYMAMVAILLLASVTIVPQFYPASTPLLQSATTFWRDITVIIVWFIPLGLLLKLFGIVILREPPYMDQPDIGKQYIGLPRMLRRLIDRFSTL